DNGWRLGAVLHHISNNGQDKKNPGVEIAALTLSIPLFGKPAAVAETAAVTPTPPPPPPPVAARNYLVFFDFTQSAPTGDARAIIKTAAGEAAREKSTKLTVTGHTDTVGSDAYNMRLSMRRAVAVQKELIHDGVPEGEIAIVAKGKRDLLVP